MSPSSRHSGGGASRRQTSCPDSGRPGSTSRRVLLATRCSRSTCCRAFQPMNRSRGRHFSAPACQPARPIQSVPRTATYRSPRPTKRRKPSSWCSAIRPSQRRRSSGRASRITTSATEGFWGKPSVPSNYQTEYEKFRPHESESTSKKNEIVLLHHWNANAGLGPGTWFWPFAMAREIAEVIRHARSLAQRFEAPETVSFRAEWHGLEDSVLMDPNHPWAEKGTGATDRGQLLPMVDAAAATGGQMSAEVLAEAGYCNEADLAALESRGIRGHVALSREGRKHAANDRDRRPATHWLGEHLAMPQRPGRLRRAEVVVGSAEGMDRGSSRVPSVP